MQPPDRAGNKRRIMDYDQDQRRPLPVCILFYRKSLRGDNDSNRCSILEDRHLMNHLKQNRVIADVDNSKREIFNGSEWAITATADGQTFNTTARVIERFHQGLSQRAVIVTNRDGVVISAYNGRDFHFKGTDRNNTPEQQESERSFIRGIWKSEKYHPTEQQFIVELNQPQANVAVGYNNDGRTPMNASSDHVQFGIQIDGKVLKKQRTGPAGAPTNPYGLAAELSPEQPYLLPAIRQFEGYSNIPRDPHNPQSATPKTDCFGLEFEAFFGAQGTASGKVGAQGTASGNGNEGEWPDYSHLIDNHQDVFGNSKNVPPSPPPPTQSSLNQHVKTKEQQIEELAALAAELKRESDNAAAEEPNAVGKEWSLLTILWVIMKCVWWPINKVLLWIVSMITCKIPKKFDERDTVKMIILAAVVAVFACGCCYYARESISQPMSISVKGAANLLRLLWWSTTTISANRRVDVPFAPVQFKATLNAKQTGGVKGEPSDTGSKSRSTGAENPLQIPKAGRFHKQSLGAGMYDKKVDPRASIPSMTEQETPPTYHHLKEDGVYL
jgi:hypothetical protein